MEISTRNYFLLKAAWQTSIYRNEKIDEFIINVFWELIWYDKLPVEFDSFNRVEVKLNQSTEKFLYDQVQHFGLKDMNEFISMGVYDISRDDCSINEIVQKANVRRYLANGFSIRFGNNVVYRSRVETTDLEMCEMNNAINNGENYCLVLPFTNILISNKKIWVDAKDVDFREFMELGEQCINEAETFKL